MATRAVRKLASVPEALQPTFTNGSWRKPAVSARRRAEMRKAALRAGNLGPHVSSLDEGWNPDWDMPRMALPVKPPKGTARQRRLPARIKRVEEGLAAQQKYSEKVAEDRRKAREKTPSQMLAAMPIYNPESVSSDILANIAKAQDKKKKQQTKKKKK